jgi:dihydrofolate reductase
VSDMAGDPAGGLGGPCRYWPVRRSFMTGSATIVRWLLADNLLDEVRLLLHPVVVGSGQKLFADGPGHRLELVEQQALSTVVVHLLYRPAA